MMGLKGKDLKEEWGKEIKREGTGGCRRGGGGKLGGR